MGTDGVPLEHFLFWSKEDFGAGKPVVTVTHVGIVADEWRRGAAAVFVITNVVSATHYVNGAVGLIGLLQDGGGRGYLIHLNRSDINPLHGFAGSFRRAVAERRIVEATPEMITLLRQRLEMGNIP